MRTLLPLLVLVALLGGSLALAGPNDDPFTGFRVHAGWVVTNKEIDNAPVYGGDFIMEQALGTVNFVQADDGDVWTFEGSYLWRAQNDPSLYYGAGAGLATAPENSDSALIFNAVIGKEFQPKDSFGGNVPFVEARYTLGSDTQMDVNIDGLRLVAGWRF